MSSSFFYVTTYWRKEFYQSKCRSTLQLVSSNFIVEMGDSLLFRPLYPEVHASSLPNQSSRDLSDALPQAQAPSCLRPVEHWPHLNLERWVSRFQAGGPYPVSPSFWKHISHCNLIQWSPRDLWAGFPHLQTSCMASVTIGELALNVLEEVCVWVPGVDVIVFCP